jgi:predicted permease
MAADMLAWIRTLPSRVRTWISSRQVDQEFDQELKTHLDLSTQENIDRGMQPEAARRAALIRLGGLTQLKETNRELRSLPLVETLMQDVRYALRMLRKSPGFTTVAVLTLALGIGANTAIFSVVYAVLLKPLPYTKPEQLFNVFEAKPQEGVGGTGWSYPNFAEFREQNRIFSEMSGAQEHQLTLTGRGEPSVIDASIVTPEVFSVFNQKPLAGRAFSSEDGKPGASPVVILSENLWRDIFAGDPNVIGSSVNLDKRTFTVVGIMPSAFRFPMIMKSEQVWVPLVQDPLFSGWMDRRGGHWLQVTGRLKPGVSMSQAQTELAAFSERLAQESPADNRGWVIRMIALRDMLVFDVKSALLILLGAVGLVLLIACANVANLLLARATARAREIAVRTTLGAGRSRIIRQLLSETAVLGLLGGFTGIVLAYFGVRALSTLLPANLPRVNAIRVDNFVLAFALLLTAIASCVFGLAPALFAANSDLQSSLREGGGRSGESRNRRRARSFLAAGEIGLAMVLLVVAGLLLRSFSNLTSVKPGFEAQNVLKASISLPQFQYSKPQQWIEFSDQLLAHIQAQPGMRNSAMAVPLPITDGFINLAFDIPGTPPPSASTSRTANFVSASPDYFRVMGIPLLAGRLFDAHDSLHAPWVTVISEAFARTHFPNQDPLGKHLKFGFPFDASGVREIVGVVGDVRDLSLGKDPGAMMYVPYDQAPFWGGNVIVRSSLSTASLANTIRQEVQNIDKDLPVTDIALLPEAIDSSMAQPRFRTLLLGLFAVMALVLAAIGIFGVISYSVTRRTNEIGIRVALGAQSADVLKQVLGEGARLAGAGLAVGLAASIVATRFLGTLLFGVKPTDPLTFAAVAVILATVTLAACYLPARGATRVDPLVALRYE